MTAAAAPDIAAILAMLAGAPPTPTPPPADPADDPLVLFTELMEEIGDAILHQPRNVQTRIGPSEIGEPCTRELIAKLMELPSAEDETKPNWRAYVGTCIHNGLEGIFRNSLQQTIGPTPRFLLEERVRVGQIGDWWLEGSCDLFDAWSGSVWDWKTKSATQHGISKRKGMGPKYQVQFHCYGMGMANAGYTVRRVGGIFVLRDGDLESSFPLSEPYNPQIALDALARADQLYALAQLVGADTAMSLYPPCTEEFCRRCGNYQPFVPQHQPTPTTMAGAIAAGTPKGRR